jgi:hypothetical protein
MAIKYWMISNRNVTKAGLGADRSSLSYWVSAKLMFKQELRTPIETV